MSKLLSPVRIGAIGKPGPGPGHFGAWHFNGKIDRPAIWNRALSDAELDTFIAECIEAAGAMSVKDLGKVMGVIKARAAGRVDMSTVSTRVRSMLTAD